MRVDELEIRGLRNLTQARLSPGPSLNVVYGANASGKTSLLEAVYLLGTARSFRNNRPQELIQHGQSMLTVAGRVGLGAGRMLRVGVQRSASETKIRVDGNAVQSASLLAQRLPILVIAPEVHDFLEGGPGVRRRLLDWGLFHVEHAYLDIWQTYYRVLKQRNAVLRRGGPESQVKAWDGEMVRAGLRLHEARKAYVHAFSSYQAEKLERFAGGTVEMRYFAGWEGGRNYGEVLEERLGADRERGYTGPGPHRADLMVTVDGRPLKGRLSRGQAKLFMAALRIGQGALLRDETGQAPVLLVDDFAAELDASGRMRLLEVVSEVGGQVFVTATERELIPEGPLGCAEVFHVEHGTVGKVV